MGLSSTGALGSVSGLADELVAKGVAGGLFINITAAEAKTKVSKRRRREKRREAEREKRRKKRGHTYGSDGTKRTNDDTSDGTTTQLSLALHVEHGSGGL